MKFKILSIALLLSGAVFAQTLDQGIKALNENKRTEAKRSLEALKADAKQGPDALLGLTLLAINNSHFEEAFGYFQEFFYKHPDPYPYVYALWNTGVFSASSNKGISDVKSFMNRLSNDPKANITLRAMAAENVADKLFGANKVNDAKDWYSKISEVRNWASVGAFENVSSSGFNKDYGVLAHPETDFSFKNNVGASVKWFTLPFVRNDRWWDFEYHYGINNSIIYGQTFLQADADMDVRMLFGVSGSFKVWINDYLVASESEERNTNLDVYQYNVKLQKGNNRILVQLGASEIDNSNFMLRFADMNGNLLSNLKSAATYSAYTKAQPYEVKSLPFFAEKYFEEQVAANPTFINRLLLVNVYNHNDKRYESRKLAQQLKKELPNSTIVSEALIEAYSRDNNRTDLTKEIEHIKSNDPESLYGVILRYSEAVDREDFDEAKKLLDQRISLYGENSDTETKKLDLLAKKKDYENLFKALETAYRKYPDNSAFVILQYSIYESQSKDLGKATAILENYLKDNYDEDIMEMVIANKFKQGKKNDGFKLYQRMLEDRPYSTMRYTRVADKYYEMQDYDNAANWQQKAIDMAPYAGSMHYSKGVIYDAAGKKANARAEYQRAIELSPSNYDARKKLRAMDGKKDLFASFKENDIAALVKAAPAAAEYPNDNSIYLLNDMQQVVYPENGASEERNQLLIKIFNQSGIDDWKEVSLPYNSYTQRLIVEKAELWKKDGSKVPAETNDNEVVFSSLEIGDVIHVLYKLESASYGKLAEHFWEDFNFNSGYPVKLARYGLIVPKSKTFNYRMYNSDLKPVITEVDEYKVHVWEKKDMPAIQSEAYMPAFTDIAERVVVTSIPDWNYVANWYSDLSNVKAKSDFEIKEKVKELFAGKPNLTELQKAKIIYDYIEQNFNYSNIPFLHSALTPQRASRTLRTRLGDCKDLSTLFVAMGKEVGLNTNLVLVDTRDNGDKNLDLPTIGFNHCIAQFKTGDKNYLVELTDNHLPFGSMGYQLLNSNGLYIPKDGGATNAAQLTKLNSTARTPNFVDRNTTLVFKGAQTEITRVNKRLGAEAATTRYNFKDKGEEDRRKDLTSSLSNEFNKKVVLKTLSISNLDNLSDTLTMSYGYTVDNFTSELLGMQIFKLPWSDSYNSLNFVSLEERKYPINLWSFSTTPVDKETMTIMLPAPKKLAEVPKNITLTHPAISYNLTYTVKPDRLIVVREVKYLKDQVLPAEYASFKEIITKINEADQKQYGLK